MQNSQLFLEQLLAITEGYSDFDVPYYYFNVSIAEISFNFLSSKKEEKKTWAQVNDLKNVNRKSISKKKSIAVFISSETSLLFSLHVLNEL